MSAEKARTGRPLKEHPSGTLVTITLQVPAELKTRLQTKALSSNRTLSQEAHRRLERSFSIEALQEDAIALAVEGAVAEYSKRMADQIAAKLAELNRIKAEHERRLAEQAREAAEQLEQMAKRSRAK
jgi:hypothetical protein